MTKFSFPLLLSAAALLSACGIVPLPPVAIPDQTLSLPASAGFENAVAYDATDAFGGASIPGVLSNVQVSGQVTYSGAGHLGQVAVYLRSSVPDCNSVPGSSARICGAASESAQRIGTITLQPGAVTGFTLSGKALDAAAKAGHGYFGVQALSGQSLPGDTLKLSGMKARAKF